MARLLILNNEYPADRTHGQHLRIHALCRELMRTHDCYFVSFSEKGSEFSDHEDLQFTEEVYLSRPEKKNRSLMRHFRLSSARYLEQSSPDYFRRTVARIRKLASQWDIDLLVNFSAGFGEIGKKIHLPRILDYPDSGTLSIERALAGHEDTRLPGLVFAVSCWANKSGVHDNIHKQNASAAGNLQFEI